MPGSSIRKQFGSVVCSVIRKSQFLFFYLIQTVEVKCWYSKQQFYLPKEKGTKDYLGNHSKHVLMFFPLSCCQTLLPNFRSYCYIDFPLLSVCLHFNFNNSNNCCNFKNSNKNTQKIYLLLLHFIRIHMAEFMSFNWPQKYRKKTVIYSIIFVVLEHSHYIASKQTILGKYLLH